MRSLPSKFRRLQGNLTACRSIAALGGGDKYAEKLTYPRHSTASHTEQAELKPLGFLPRAVQPPVRRRRFLECTSHLEGHICRGKVRWSAPVMGSKGMNRDPSLAAKWCPKEWRHYAALLTSGADNLASWKDRSGRTVNRAPRRWGNALHQVMGHYSRLT